MAKQYSDKSPEILIWILTDRGFGSEINNLLYASYFSNANNLRLVVNSSYWNFGIENGLPDYFNFEELQNKKINNFLKFWKKYLPKLTILYEDITVSQFLTKHFVTSKAKENRRLRFKEDLMSCAFKLSKRLWGIKNKFSFEYFTDIRAFSIQLRKQDPFRFNQQIHSILLNIWNLKNSISENISNLLADSGIDNLENYGVFHVRRGDKIAAKTMEDRLYSDGEYMSKLKFLDSSISNIYIMTDDYQVISDFQEQYPEFNYFSLCQPENRGHDQDTFNSLSPDQHFLNGIILLAELEVARKSKLFIGSSGSNIYRLIEYFKLEQCHDLSTSKCNI